MDIPYTVEARPDTGLYNAKLGMWLFLASEVMLFGALFSSYILLRVGAAPGMWPHGLLNIPIGTFNTAVLITSSITVVMAWASLKLGNFGRFRIYQGITLLCAMGFVGIKSIEYKDKFTHYEIWKTDGTRMTGHIEGSPWFWTKATLERNQLKSITFHPDATHYAAPKSQGAAAAAHEESHGSGEHSHGAAGHGAEAAHGAGAGHAALQIPVSDIARLSSFVPAHSTYFAIYFTLTGLHALHVIGGALVIAYLWVTGARMWRLAPERFTNRVEVSGLFWHFVDLVWIFLFPVLYLL